MTVYGEIRTRLTQEERDFVRKLIGMANNLNQLAKACHQEGLLQTLVYFESYRSELDEILKRLKP
ncbi:MAG TPA: plasmid mobilization relaxosome protein MobC [Flavisolibacter sp.]|nr:plasmid mobilization relaxosome protein MobC [Flavisolibacter sp.]